MIVYQNTINRIKKVKTKYLNGVCYDTIKGSLFADKGLSKVKIIIPIKTVKATLKVVYKQSGNIKY